MFTDFAEVVMQDGMGSLSNDVAASQQSRGLRASGKSADSLMPTTEVFEARVVGQLWGDKSWYFQQNGRGPNKSGKPNWALVQAIEAWVKVKGISISPWAIATKIAREGIKVPNRFNPGGVLSEPLNPERVKGLLGPRLRGAVLKELRSTIFDTKQ